MYSTKGVIITIYASILEGKASCTHSYMAILEEDLEEDLDKED